VILPDDIVQQGLALKDRYFDVSGLAAYSALGESTIRDYIRSAGLPCFKIKGKLLFKQSEFDKWLERFRINKKQDVGSLADGVLADLRRPKSDR
jgi:hypothetical protein